jgi:hypothetical protein
VKALLAILAVLLCLLDATRNMVQWLVFLVESWRVTLRRRVELRALERGQE